MTRYLPVFPYLVLFAGALAALVVSARAHADRDPFSLPVTSIKTVVESASRWPAEQRVKVAGTVTLHHSSGSIFLQDATGAIYADATTNSHVRVGDFVEVIGVIDPNGFSATLRDCSYRALGRHGTVQPETATGEQLKSGALDMHLVRVAGPLLAEPISRADAQLLPIRVDQILVTLMLVEFRGSPLSQLRPGCLLQATGVCSVAPDAQHRPAAIRIQLRSGDDIVVLHGPPWWTPQRAALIFGLAAAVTLASVGWAAMLRHRQLGRVLEQRVRERTAELELANRDLESFSYSVSHDLRAPLRAMAGFSEALAEDYGGALGPTGNAYVQRIREAAGQMNRLIDGLLSLARVTRGELRRETVDLSALAAAVVEELKHAHPEANVEVTIQPGMLDSADRDLLRIVLANLLQNAWKFTRRTRNPKIEVGTVSDRKTVVYYVRDNGAGFDPAYSKKLFQVFQRLHSAAEYEGTGIGLVTVQKIIHRHGGKVWAEGKVNGGACFFFTLHGD